MKEFINEVFDPTGNGNCGYCCVAKALGYEEDGWFRVRNEMLNKAKEKRRVYSRLMGDEAGFNSMINAVEVKSKDADIEESKWLSKMDHGQLIANTYQRPIVFLLVNEGITFLPLQIVAPGEGDPVYLLHVNQKHWVFAYV
jgi:uncharacterized cysteine cluster protein YcgN (CxxCxxCC family)